MEALGAAGFTGIGLYHDGLADSLEREAEGTTRAEKLAWMKQLFDDNGISVVELEFLTGWLYPIGHPRRDGEQPTRELLLDAASALGTRHMKVANIDGAHFEVDQLASTFGAVCDEAAQAGMRVGLEVLPPDPNCRSLAQALEWIDGNANGGFFFDAWHVNNIPTITYADIAALPAGRVVGVELDDGLAFDEDDLRDFADAGAGFIQMTGLRRLAGEGDYDIDGFIRAVAATGFDGPWGHEVLSDDQRRLPMAVGYRRAYRAVARLLDGALGELHTRTSDHSPRGATS